MQELEGPPGTWGGSARAPHRPSAGRAASAVRAALAARVVAAVGLVLIGGAALAGGAPKAAAPASLPLGAASGEGPSAGGPTQAYLGLHGKGPADRPTS